MPELLLELLSEEIPARMQAAAAEQLKRLVTKELDAAGLSYTDARAYVTPRRLTLVVEGLPKKQPDRRIERKGPRTDAPEKAIKGFLRSAGLDSLDQCEKRQFDKGEFWFAVKHEKGRPTAEVLAAAIIVTIVRFPWPKSMVWGDLSVPFETLIRTKLRDIVEPIFDSSDETPEDEHFRTRRFKWVRPIHSFLGILDGKSIPGRILAGGDQMLRFGMSTIGHRFLAPKPFEVKGFKDYKAKLRQAHVMLDPQERRDTIWREAGRIAEAQGLNVKEDPALLAEMAGLVEWPSVLMGAIDPAFLDLPPEVLTTSMRTHQKFFSVVMPDGALAPHFIAVANVPVTDEICSGYERVLRARLADAKFFWDQDRKQTLTSRTTALKDIVFHARLGTVAEKVERMNVLAGTLAEHVPGADPKLCRRAALLCKADLTTEMVGEFPELQGVMGRYYALADGEDAAVADAIAAHYAPAGPGDACPTKPVSVAVALADKIDTLVSFWAIDERPTGSRDPYALRRAALGVIRLILENQLRLPLSTVFGHAIHPLSDNPAVRAAIRSMEGAAHRDVVVGELLDFIADRLFVQQREKGIRHDMIRAVFAVRQAEQARRGDVIGDVFLHRVLKRVQALGEFLGTDDGADLLTAYRRATNIVDIEEKKDGVTFEPAIYDPELAQGKEADLWHVLERTGEKFEPLVDDEKFVDAMTTLAQLRGPVDAFFDHVTVNVDEAKTRRNRLRLLANITTTMNKVADFSQIEGGER